MTKLRNSEVIPVAELASKHLQSDISHFRAFSSSFTNDYVAKFNQSIEELRPQVNPPELSLKIFELKKKYHSTLHEIRTKLTAIDDMCLLYKNRLVVPRGQFRIYEVRREVRKENIKGVYSGLEATFMAIRKNMLKLESVGFNNLLIEELDDLRKQLLSISKELDGFVAQQKELFASNQEKISQLQSQVSFINKYGKLVFRNADPQRREVYTMAHAINEVRSQQRAMLKSE